MARTILLAALALTMFAMPAQAQSRAQLDSWWRVCSDNKAQPDDRIRNCTLIVELKRETQRNRAIAYTHRGNAWFSKREFDRAIEDFTQSIRLNPKDAIAHFNRGNTWHEKRDYERAIADYSEAIRLNPKYHVAFNNRGVAWDEKNDFSRAIDDYNIAIRLDPRNPTYLTNRCRAHGIDGRNLFQGLLDCNELLQLRPDNIGTLEQRALVLLRLNRLDEAIVDYDAVLRSNSQNANALYGRGLAKFRKGDINGGKADIAAATALRPNVGTFFAGLGLTPPKIAAIAMADRTLCAGDGPLDDRIKACTTIIQAADEPPQNRAAAYNHRGSIWQRRGDFDRAIADFTEAIKLNPSFADAYHNRGSAWDERGDLDRAIDDFTQAINIDRKLAPTHFLRGFALMRKGLLDRAIADFSQAISIDASYHGAYLNRGIAHLAKGDYNRATTDFGTAIKLNPSDAASFYNRGRSLLYAGNPASQALADLNQASELDPTSAYHVLWTEIAARRANAPSRMKQAMATMDKSRWPAPVALLFLGEMSMVSAVTAAFHPNPMRRREQVCEANFLIGHWVLRQGDKKEAAQLFRAAAKDCPAHFMEGNAARVELRTLGESP